MEKNITKIKNGNHQRFTYKAIGCLKVYRSGYIKRCTIENRVKLAKKKQTYVLFTDEMGLVEVQSRGIVGDWMYSNSNGGDENDNLWEIIFYVMTFPIITVLCWLLVYMVYICNGFTPGQVQDEKSWRQKLPTFIIILLIVYGLVLTFHVYLRD